MSSITTQFKKGMTPHNKGKKGLWNRDSRITKECISCGGDFKVYKAHSSKRITCSRECIAIQMKGKASWNKGSKGFMAGEKHYNWKGGISKIDKLCRQVAEYKKWRSDVFQRDNWKCRTCNESGIYVTAHHINGFSKIIKENKIRTLEQARNCSELWDTNNGVTLCEACHSLTDNYKGRAKNYKLRSMVYLTKSN